MVRVKHLLIKWWTGSMPILRQQYAQRMTRRGLAVLFSLPRHDFATLAFNKFPTHTTRLCLIGLRAVRIGAGERTRTQGTPSTAGANPDRAAAYQTQPRADSPALPRLPRQTDSSSHPPAIRSSFSPLVWRFCQPVLHPAAATGVSEGKLSYASLSTIRRAGRADGLANAAPAGPENNRPGRGCGRSFKAARPGLFVSAPCLA